MKTKLIFCANEQTEMPHVISLNENGNGEIVFTCECGRFVKVPGDMETADIEAALLKHKEANQGQISVEKYQEMEAKAIDSLADADTEEVKPE